MLEVRDLTVKYGAITALHGISFSVNDGAIAALIGGNGAGKTTTLRAVSGLIKSQGEILFNGRSLAGLPPAQIVASGVVACVSSK